MQVFESVGLQRQGKKTRYFIPYGDPIDLLGKMIIIDGKKRKVLKVERWTEEKATVYVWH